MKYFRASVTFCKKNSEFPKTFVTCRTQTPKKYTLKANKIYLYCLCFFICSNLQANVFFINQDQSTYDLEASIEFLEDSNIEIKDFNASLLQSKFQSYLNHSLDLKSHTYYWGNLCDRWLGEVPVQSIPCTGVSLLQLYQFINYQLFYCTYCRLIKEAVKVRM